MGPEDLQPRVGPTRVSSPRAVVRRHRKTFAKDIYVHGSDLCTKAAAAFGSMCALRLLVSQLANLLSCKNRTPAPVLDLADDRTGSVSR